MFKLSGKQRWLSYILAGGATLLFLWYLAENADRYKSLLQFSAANITLLIALAVGTGITNGLSNYLLFRAMQAKLGLAEALGLAFMTTLANQLPFSGGLITKGVYLKQRHQLPYTEYFSATVALYIFTLVMSGAAGIFAIVILSLNNAEISWVLSSGFFALCALGLVFFIPIKVELLPEKWQAYFTALLKGWVLWKQNYIIAAKLTVVQIIAFTIMAGRLWVAFHAMSQDVSLIQCLMFAAGATLTQLLNVTPGGIGVREALVGGISALSGLDAGISVVAVALDRLVSTTAIVALGVVSTIILSQNASTQP